MNPAHDLADRFHQRWLHANPLDATVYGIAGYDDMLPDITEDGQHAWRAEVQQILRDAVVMARQPHTLADGVTLDCAIQAAAQEVSIVDLAQDEYTVTAMHFAGPASFLAVAATTVLADPNAAEAYVTRLRHSGAWIDQICQRLRTGASRGRTPVVRLAEQAISWAEQIMATRDNSPVLAPAPPPDWPGAAAWEQARRAAIAEVVHPALGRWVATIKELMPQARSADHIGLAWLPDGDAQYARAIQVNTTMPLSAHTLHTLGLEQITALEDQAARLGDRLGLHGRDVVFAALRESPARTPIRDAMRRAAAAVRRAEVRAGEFFPDPLPPPCEVAAMPEVVALGGAAPHYTPPRLDGGRPGTFWFNTTRPTAGAGWDLEAVAFHEAVPGHHLQTSRLQLLDGLPALQRQRIVPVFSEGWGLYAEQLAQEAGLYSDDHGLLGAVGTNLMRAVRLVVDTGIHAFGWSRDRALQFAIDHAPLSREFLIDEIDRYIVMPGQALAYITGKLEMLRIRDDARRRLGPAFALPTFHAAVLDQGSLPMPTLARSVTAWLDRQAAPVHQAQP